MNTFYAGGNFILNTLYGSGTPATYKLGLCSAEPSHSSITNELSGGGYVRLTIDNNTTTFPNASTVGDTCVKVNGVAFEWDVASGVWLSPTHWFIYDSTNSRPLSFGVIGHLAQISAGDAFRIAAGGLRIILK